MCLRLQRTSSILSPVRRVPLCAAGLSGLICLMKTPLIISPLLSLRPMPLPPIMLMPRDWPAARVRRTLKDKAGYKKHPRVLYSTAEILLLRGWWTLVLPGEKLLGLKHCRKNTPEGEFIQRASFFPPSSSLYSLLSTDVGVSDITSKQ